MKIEWNTIYHMDCLEGMKDIPNKSIDMILCDLPYGITDYKWDVIIPFSLLWKQYERIIKDDGAIVLTACSGFTNQVINSNLKLYRYKWIWIKNNVTNPLNAKNRPMNSFEEVLVFSKSATANGAHKYNRMKYYPQGVVKLPQKYDQANQLFETMDEQGAYKSEYTNYPNDILYFVQDKDRFHPTQKPVQLFEYLVKTYTNEGDVVLDNCMGSGTTAIACLNTGRNFIGFETDEVYYQKALKRIKLNNRQMKFLI